MEKDMVAIDGTNENEIKRSKPEEKLISQIIRGQLYYVYEKVWKELREDQDHIW